VRQLAALAESVTPELLESLSDSELETIDQAIRSALEPIRSVTAKATMFPWHRRALQDCHRRLSAASYAISRGYAPGHLPSRAEREAAAKLAS
jgi:hypothetical protein